VKGFLPPLVNRQTESGNTRAVVSGQVKLLGDGESSDQSLGSCNWVWFMSIDASESIDIMKLTCRLVTNSVVRERSIDTVRETSLRSACECLSRGSCSKQCQCRKRK
jgi:hypothetical protein